jgi:dynein heavy chain
MYQYSLTWFIDLYLNTINASAKTNVVKRRLKNLEQYFTYSLYCNVCRSLFEKDKLLFSFLLCINVLKSRSELEESELQFLLTGGVGLTQNALKNPDPSWISDKAWTELCSVSQLRGLRGFVADFKVCLALNVKSNFTGSGMERILRIARSSIGDTAGQMADVDE